MLLQGIGDGEDKTTDQNCEVESFRNGLWLEYPPGKLEYLADRMKNMA